jgi:nitroimidazol reductase NimA-like FMN-containing flavoprotein (pyridoxamine 5'-phosphate oxidase superfamily)
VNVDSAGLEVLSPTDCLALAATVPIGRIVFSDQALPAVQPVNFLLDDGCVIFRTGEGTKLAAVLRDTVVAFEIDDYDAGTESGWSVTVVGRAESVNDTAETARLARLPLRTWAPGNRDRFIRVHPEYISGRRILAADVDGLDAAERAGDEVGAAARHTPASVAVR